MATSFRAEDLSVECTHCGVMMSSYLGSGGRVRYSRCGSCHRWVSSAYEEVFRGDTKVRSHRADARSSDASFASVKLKLERWLGAVEQTDPHRTLGVSASASVETIRARYRELAFAHHPDRGGSQAKMQEINLAYEKLLQHRNRQARQTVAPRR